MFPAGDRVFSAAQIGRTEAKTEARKPFDHFFPASAANDEAACTCLAYDRDSWFAYFHLRAVRWRRL